MKSNAVALWTKRIVCYVTGLFIMALGVVFSVKSALGVSPVSCLANVLYQIFGVDQGMEMISLGVCTTGSFCFFILIEALILRRDFKAHMLLQIIASTIFGLLVNLATAVLAFIPAPQTYVMRLVFLFISIPLIAFGVMTYLAPSLISIPGEGVSLAVSKKTGKSVATCKSITDCCMVLFAAIVSLIYFHKLVGVREGTIISAPLVGIVMRRLMRWCNPWLLKFVERESKLEKAISEVAENLVVAAQKVIITISREYGSEGQTIGRKVAQRLGIAYHEDDLMELEAEVSGLPLEYVQNHEKRMTGAFTYDLLSTNYAYSPEELPPQERLFAASTKVLRTIAAKDESCVIMGRCSDYILYKDPNSFRIFIHAPDGYRYKRVAENKHIPVEKAMAEVRRTDLGRARYYQQFANREWGNTKYYNLAVDTAVYGVDKSVDLICEAVRLWRAKREEAAVSNSSF